MEVKERLFVGFLVDNKVAAEVQPFPHTVSNFNIGLRQFDII